MFLCLNQVFSMFAHTSKTKKQKYDSKQMMMKQADIYRRCGFSPPKLTCCCADWSAPEGPANTDPPTLIDSYKIIIVKKTLN